MLEVGTVDFTTDCYGKAFKKVVLSGLHVGV